MNITVAVHEASHAVVAVRTVGSHGLAKNGVVTLEPKGNSLGRIHPKRHGRGARRQERSIVISLAGGIGECRVNPRGELELGIDSDTRNIIYFLGDYYGGKCSIPFHDAETILMVRSDDFPYKGVQEAIRASVSKWKPDQAVPAKMLIFDVTAAVRELCIAGNDVKAVQRLIAQPRIWQSDWFRLLGRLTNRTSELLDQHWSDVIRLANKLLEVGSMTGPDAEAFIRAEKAVGA